MKTKYCLAILITFFLICLSFPLINAQYVNQIANGDFEQGENYYPPTGWDYNENPCVLETYYAYEGTYGIDTYQKNLIQELNTPIEVNNVVSFSIYGLALSDHMDLFVNVYYSDEDYSFIPLINEVEYEEWNYYNLLPELTAGKTIETIEVFGGTSNFCYADNFKLLTLPETETDLWIIPAWVPYMLIILAFVIPLGMVAYSYTMIRKMKDIVKAIVIVFSAFGLWAILLYIGIYLFTWS